MNFDLEDKLCDSEELISSCLNTNISDTIVYFFVEFFNLSKTHILKDINPDETDNPDETFDEYEFRKISYSDKQRKGRLLKATKIKSIVQILYYNIHSGRKLTPFHVMNSVQIYERCSSKE